MELIPVCCSMLLCKRSHLILLFAERCRIWLDIVDRQIFLPTFYYNHTLIIQFYGGILELLFGERWRICLSIATNQIWQIEL